MKFTRRDTLVLAAAASALSLSGMAPALAADGDTVDMAKLMAPTGFTDKVQGSPDAPVTVIEYASPTCPHCATFSNTVLAPFEEAYVKPGDVKFILRPFVRNVLDAAVFMLAEAAGETNYHNVISTYFKTQQTWGTSDKPRDAILEIAKQLGFTQETFDAALTNQALFTGMESLRDQALNEFGLAGTPTFYINGKTLSGEKTLEQLAAEIDPLLPAGTAPVPAAGTTPAAPAPTGETATPVAPAETATPVAPAAPAETTTPVAPAAPAPAAP
ncbi:MAG: Periplasmic thiol:disulfide interchange protein DsbA [Devosia sp.]|uniref:thioredoxin domain-containing protein n=1 Tax=Devosia sp. TaxID=1871048 RepID=UPI00262CBF6D|nr:thioredoxin domain-containing protein [Devosia sp.]MDB5537603.1 Periplasmic thiol:disulfide interchange protein DsbA [Devosia sp.]MDB5588088.1 Periplasmic thiol:disulfide interchange protein DsbA [Devosia sp.]